VPTMRDGWTMITLHGGHEHMVHHDFHRVVQTINQARAS
jgi:predicted RNA binding protein YcfA (HicA-like mRNA interferase family)